MSCAALPVIVAVWAIALASARENDSSATDAEILEEWLKIFPVLEVEVPADGCPIS